MGRYIVFPLLVHIVVASPVLAQPTSTSPADVPVKTVQPLAPPLSCDRLTTTEGLPSSTVRAIIQDRRGFIWFGTEDGLARYDGIKIRVYRTIANDPTSISGGFVTALAFDAAGKLWVGTAESGVNLYDPETDKFTRFGQKDGKGGLSSDGVTSIARDRSGAMWFAMSNGGLNRFDAATGTFKEFVTEPLDVAITAIDVDMLGNLWLGTATGAVLKWNPASTDPTTYRALRPDGEEVDVPTTALRVSTSGTVWVGSDGEGLFALDPRNGKFTPHRHSPTEPGTISDDHISVLFEDQRGVLWVGTQKGLNRMDAGRVVRYEHDALNPLSLSFPEVQSIYQDQGGVMWIGGLSNGVCGFSDARRAFGHHYTGGTYGSSFFEDADKTLWVGTYTGGLYKYDRAGQRVTIYKSLKSADGDPPIRLDQGWMSAVYRGRSGTLWVAVKGQGLIAFDTKTETARQYMPDPEDPKQIPVDFIQKIWGDDADALWLGSWGGALVRFDVKREEFTAFGASAGITSDYIADLVPDPADNKYLWLGAAKGGLIKFNTVTNTATVFRKSAEGLSSDDVVAVYPEPGGIVWVGTFGGGLNRLDPATGKAERFTTSNSQLTNDSVFGILPGDDGKLWLSTNGGGLLQFDPKTKQFLEYDSSDGVQGDVFGQGSSMRSKSGELFFGGAGGFNAFFPKDIKRDTFPPPLVLTAFKINNRDVKLDRPIWTLTKLRTSYADSFELQFAALSFAAPKKNRYAYKLEGFDEDFVETDRPFAAYAKLGGGNYVLRVRAANHHGVWNETGIGIKLGVTPPLWRTWPAFVLYAIVIASVIFLFLRYQRQRVLRVEREGRLAIVEHDLALTGAVQSGFLPDQDEVTTTSVQLFGFYRPADLCSGDWWWHEQLPNGRHVVLVGDVTGHGPGPAMVTAAVATAFRVLIENGLNDVSHGLELLNHEVLRVAKGKYHMTLAALELEEATGRWLLYSAGAPPMLSLNDQGKHRVHFCPGTPLGTENEEFELGTVTGTLSPHDRLLLYTDGMPEIELPNGTVVGMRRFAQLYERTRGQDLRQAATTMVTHADESLAGQPQLDDWTFTMIEWTGESTIVGLRAG